MMKKFKIVDKKMLVVQFITVFMMGFLIGGCMQKYYNAYDAIISYSHSFWWIIAWGFLLYSAVVLIIILAIAIKLRRDKDGYERKGEN